LGIESYHYQVAALPIRHRRGELDVLLVTSRETKRWVIPKGWPMDGRTDYDAAKIEAFEEAGVEGHIGTISIGEFEYIKRVKKGATQPCRVSVYPLNVSTVARKWPEQSERERRWFSAQDAAQVVSEQQLRDIILALQFSGGCQQF
jgi:8-oxo-dGTP pyrophosphatase MutT (NUDIX family)